MPRSATPPRSCTTATCPACPSSIATGRWSASSVAATCCVTWSVARASEPGGAVGVRQAWAEIDLAAIAHNVAALREHVAPARLGAVVKADGYGHGAVEVARAALAAGADGLGVALVEEGAQLRAA